MPSGPQHTIYNISHARASGMSKITIFGGGENSTPARAGAPPRTPRNLGPQIATFDTRVKKLHNLEILSPGLKK